MRLDNKPAYRGSLGCLLLVSISFSFKGSIHSGGPRQHTSFIMLLLSKSTGSTLAESSIATMFITTRVVVMSHLRFLTEDITAFKANVVLRVVEKSSCTSMYIQYLQ